MDVCDQTSYIAVRDHPCSTKSFQNQRASAARPVQPLLLCSNKCFFFLITLKDGAERKQLLSNSEDGFSNDNHLLDMLLGRAFLQLFVIRCSDAAGNEAVQFMQCTSLHLC